MTAGTAGFVTHLNFLPRGGGDSPRPCDRSPVLATYCLWMNVEEIETM